MKILKLCLGVCSLILSSVAFCHQASLNHLSHSKLQNAVKSFAQKMLIPGTMIAFHTPKEEFNISYGTTELGKNTPPNINTHFRIASNTKTMTSAVIVQLAQEGKLKFDDPVSTYIPDVPNGDHITIDLLLKMRSGLYNYTSDPNFAKILDDQPQKAWKPDEVLAIAFKHKSLFAPGESYDYCNTNYVLLGLIAEQIEKKPLRDIFQERLFGPLGMKDTFLPTISTTQIPVPYSHGYMYGKSSFALVDKPYPREMIKKALDGTLKPIDYTFQNPSYATAPGGVISTVHDLSIWIEALVSGKVFNKEYYDKWMNSVQLEDPTIPNGQFYGYGIARQTFSKDSTFYFHGGEMPGFNSFICYDPVNKITLVIWTNLTESLEHQPTAYMMMFKILEKTGLLQGED